MINELKAMAIFAEVVKQGSFRKAAVSLSLSPSVVSYHITQLENKVGSGLLHRSTRSVKLSHEGETFYQQVLKMLEAAEQGMALLSSNQQEPSGKLSVSMPSALGRSALNRKLAAFAQKYPKIHLNIDFSDSKNHIIDNQVDLTFRAGPLTDSDFKSTRLGNIERVVVCAPAVYNTLPKPVRPEDLSQWPWLKLSQLSDSRTFVSGSERVSVSLLPRITVNSVEAIYQYCLEGVGLAVLSVPQVLEDIASGRLVRVLPDWDVEALPLYAIWSKNTGQHSPAKRLLNFLKSS